MNGYRIVDFSETQSGREISVSSDEAVRAYFKDVRDRRSWHMDLESTENGTLTIAISGKLGWVQHRDTEREPVDLCAVPSSDECEDCDVEFNIGGTSTPISRRVCLPTSYVVEIAATFVATGKLWDRVVWKDARRV